MQYFIAIQHSTSEPLEEIKTSVHTTIDYAIAWCYEQYADWKAGDGGVSTDLTITPTVPRCEVKRYSGHYDETIVYVVQEISI